MQQGKKMQTIELEADSRLIEALKNFRKDQRAYHSIPAVPSNEQLLHAKSGMLMVSAEVIAEIVSNAAEKKGLLG